MQNIYIGFLVYNNNIYHFGRLLNYGIKESKKRLSAIIINLLVLAMTFMKWIALTVFKNIYELKRNGVN